MRLPTVPGLKVTAALLLAAALAPAAPPESLQFAVEWRLIPAGTGRTVSRLRGIANERDRKLQALAQEKAAALESEAEKSSQVA